MTALEELLADQARAAAARFFIRAGRATGLRYGEPHTLPLFGLVLILEAEGLLASHTPEKGHGRDHRRVTASRNGAEVGAPASAPAPHAELERCRALIRAVPPDLGCA